MLNFKTREELEKDLSSNLEELESVSKREAELEEEIESAETEEELDNSEKEIEKLKEKKKELEEEKSKLEAAIKEIEEKNEENKEKERKIDMNKDIMLEKRQKVNDFIRTYGQKREGLKTTDVGVLIPTEIINTPENQVKTVVDLTQLVNKQKVGTGSGSYPILKRATAIMHTVEELDENPELAKPDFKEVKWEVETYRSDIPISQEAIADSQVDLIPLVAENAREQKVNTSNAKIVEVFKKFEEKTVSDADGLKDIINVDLDPGYNKVIIASQSFYNELDKLKDKNGRYLLQDNIAASSGKGVLGIPIEVVSDTLFSEAGTAQAFIGDARRAVLFADREDLILDWMQHHIYGRYLGAFTRFTAVQADEDAGFLVTFDGAPEA